MPERAANLRFWFTPIASQLREPASEERREWGTRLAAALQQDKWIAESPHLLDRLAELLDVELAPALMDCWKTNDRIREAIRHSRATPRETIVVSLADHTLDVEFHPTLELIVTAGRTETKHVLTFDLPLSCTLAGAEFQVRNGVVQRITAASCAVIGTLEYQSLVLARAPRPELGPMPLQYDLKPEPERG